MSPSKPPGREALSPSTSTLRRLAASLAAVGVVAVAPAARASPLFQSVEPDPLDMRLDTAQGEWPTQDSPSGGLLIGIEAAVRLSSHDRNTFGAFAFVAVPLDRFARPSRRTLPALPAAYSQSSIAEAPAAPQSPVESPAASEPKAPVQLAPAPPAPVLSGELARGAVREACKAAGLDSAGARLDSLSSRAKTSALLPELRLRATRAIDESESLAPTEYDPLRRTATGGSSTWLEARATFRLDRLVFADDEIAVERLRMARAAERARLVAKVLDLLDAWQRARASALGPDLKADARQRAMLAVAAAEASLDVLTAGWFSKRIASLPPASASPSGGVAEPAEPNAIQASPAPQEGGGRAAGELDEDPPAPSASPVEKATTRECASAKGAKDRSRDAKGSARQDGEHGSTTAGAPNDTARPSAKRAAPRKK